MTVTGYCGCGCGRLTTISPRSCVAKGYVKGEPRRFVAHHHLRCRPITTAAGYRKHWVNNRPQNEHRLVAARALGRPLPPGAVVHHVDGDKTNNQPANLVICQDVTYHMLLHARQRVRAAGGDPNTQSLCCTCGQVKDLESFGRDARKRRTGKKGICRPCERAYMRAYEATRPPRLHRSEFTSQGVHP